MNERHRDAIRQAGRETGRRAALQQGVPEKLADPKRDRSAAVLLRADTPLSILDEGLGRTVVCLLS
jgi:hypothetical protein